MTQYVRFELNGKIGYGIKNGEMIEVLDRNFLEDARPTGEQLKLSDVRLLAPVAPPNIICIGLNYKAHGAAFGQKLPELPLIFLKTTTALTDPEKNRHRQRILLQGDIPSPLNPPPGCRFHTRCPYATERCSQEMPELKEVSPGHFAACHNV